MLSICLPPLRCLFPRTSFFRHRSHPLSKSHLSLSFSPDSPSIPSLTSTVSRFSFFPFKPSSTFNPLLMPRIANHQIQASSSSSSLALPSSSSLVTQGTKPLPFLLSISIVPKPVEVTPQSWQLLSIFLSTIVGLVVSPLSMGAWAFLGLTTSVVTKKLSFSVASNAFIDQVIWLVVISFFVCGSSMAVEAIVESFREWVINGVKKRKSEEEGYDVGGGCEGVIRA